MVNYDYLGPVIEIHAHRDGTVEMMSRVDITHEEAINLMKTIIEKHDEQGGIKK